ncbi:acetyltransferase [Rubellicoccus peritrichatus]|uniref:Acetyltransferase n=1 Tax=Rubellicoccus peritrichatus TaxID=3080537 RepID=A0AAQ3LEB7_9BACT|nr:acetyltransferase [Puniceicoccus sp. CR14]WOO42954.1 acetyltransferase [Puniceicoccus sp. CR14]
MKQNLIIVGCNGNCIDIADTVEAIQSNGGSMSLIGFLDDSPDLAGSDVCGYPVLGKLEDGPKFAEAFFVNGIGSPTSYSIKRELINKVCPDNNRWATIIHPKAQVSRHAEIGNGTVLLANASVGAFAKVGNHCFLLQNACVSHHSIVEDYTSLAVGVCISGGCHIGSNCYLGSNSVFRENISIGDKTLVGMGSVVTKSFPGDQVIIGNPAHPKS